ncbi:MAG: PadR family transcriptional regulator [Bacteroidota bacterium]
MKLISRTEELLLLVVCRLQADAYGLNIRDEVEAVSGKRFSVGGVYVPLDRLVRKGMLKTEKGAPTAERMGRPRKRYIITNQGLAMLREARAMHDAMWTGLPEHIATQLRLVG